MQSYNTLFNKFIQYKHFLGYKYKTDEIIMKEIVKYLTDNKITKITKKVTEDYARINLNLSSNTISRNMGVFREFCYFLKYQEGIDCYQIPNKIYPQNHNNFTPYIFSYKQINLIYANLSTPLKNYRYNYYRQTVYPIIIKILYQTGIRIGELLNIKLKNYEYDLSVFKLEDTKNNCDRYVAIPNTLNEEIYNYVNKFYNDYNLDECLFKVSESTILKYFKTILKISNIIITDKGPRLHDLRHTFVVHNIDKAIKNGDDFNNFLPILQAQLGHKTLNSLAYYFHIIKDILKTINEMSENELGYLIPEVGEYNE